jgi:hypothetical protein
MTLGDGTGFEHVVRVGKPIVANERFAFPLAVTNFRSPFLPLSTSRYEQLFPKA